jgi:hypothetical protein
VLSKVGDEYWVSALLMAVDLKIWVYCMRNWGLLVFHQILEVALAGVALQGLFLLLYIFVAQLHGSQMHILSPQCLREQWCSILVFL